MRMVWIAMPVQSCGMQRTENGDFMLIALLVSSILRGQAKHICAHGCDGTTSVGTDVLSERKRVHCVLMEKLMENFNIFRETVCSRKRVTTG